MAPKGGIRKRMLEAADTPDPTTEHSSSTSGSASVRKGGIRQRMARATETPENLGQDGVDYPLLRSFRKDWGLALSHRRKSKNMPWEQPSKEQKDLRN